MLCALVSMGIIGRVTWDVCCPTPGQAAGPLISTNKRPIIRICNDSSEFLGISRAAAIYIPLDCCTTSRRLRWPWILLGMSIGHRVLHASRAPGAQGPLADTAYAFFIVFPSAADHARPFPLTTSYLLTGDGAASVGPLCCGSDAESYIFSTHSPATDSHIRPPRLHLQEALSVVVIGLQRGGLQRPSTLVLIMYDYDIGWRHRTG